MAPREHPPRRLLRHQECPEGRHRERSFHLRRIEIDQRTARAVARVVDHNLGRADAGIQIGKQSLDFHRARGIARKDARTNVLCERIEVIRAPRRERNPDAFAGEYTRKRGAQACARADNESCVESFRRHDAVLLTQAFKCAACPRLAWSSHVESICISVRPRESGDPGAAS